MTYNEALRVVLDVAKDALHLEEIEASNEWIVIEEAIRVLESTHEAEVTRE